MPYLKEDAPIKARISHNLSTGVYKLRMEKTRRSPVWKLFALITEAAGGSIINNFVYCTKCKMICRSEGLQCVYLYRHICFIQLHKLKNRKDDKTTAILEEGLAEGQTENLLINEENKVHIKTFKNHPAWESFSLTVVDDDYIAKAVVACRECKKIIDYNAIADKFTHKCLQANGKECLKMLPSRNDVQDKLKSEVGMKVNTGAYKLHMKRQGVNSKTWKLYALVSKADGSPIKNYVWCTKCKRMLKAGVTTSNGLNTHKCFLDLRTTSSSKTEKPQFLVDRRAEIRREIHEGLYKLQMEPNDSSQLWKILARIITTDGCLIDSYVYCTKCKNVLDYNGWEKIRLYRHECILYDTQEDSGSSVKRKTVDGDTADREKLESDVKKPRAGEEEEDVTIIPSDVDDSNSSNTLSSENAVTQNNAICLAEDSEAIWSRFEYISMDDGSTLKDVVSCSQCKMVLNYDGITNIQLHQHKCYSMAPSPIRVGDGCDLEFNDNSKTKKSPDSSKICVKKENGHTISNEYNNDDPQESSSRGSHQTTLPHRQGEYQNHVQEFRDLLSNETIEYKMEETMNFGLRNSRYNDSNVTCHKEEIEDEIICLDSPNSGNEEDMQSNESIEIKEEEPKNSTLRNTTTLNASSPICIKKGIQKTICLARENSWNQEDNNMQKTINICTEWIVEDFATLITLELQGFQKLISYWLKLGARYGENLDIESTLTNARIVVKHLEQMSEMKKSEIKLKIKENIKKSENLAISIDICPENIIKKNFLIATLHLNKNNEVFDICLGAKSMDFSQTSSVIIRNKLENLLSNFGLNNLKEIVFVTEGDTDMEKALVGCTHLKCSRYLFSKSLDAAIGSTTELSDLIKTCKVVEKYLKSTNQLNLTELSTDMPSKSHYALFQIITLNWSKIIDILAVKKETLGVQDASIASLQSLIKLCQRFVFIFKRLQETQTSSLCFVIPSIQRLKTMCAANSKDFPEIKALKINLSKFIEEIWVTNINIWHKAACFLYPPAKQEQEHHLNEIKQFCLKRMKLLTPIPAENDSTNLTEKLESTADETDEMDFFFPNLFKSPDSQSNTANNAEEEINCYCQEKIMFDKNFNVLQWWHNNSSKYTLLSRLALQVLSIPACRRESKHLISLTKNVLNENRPILGRKNVENILHLNSLR